MGKFIGIKKYQEENNLHCYRVFTDDFGGVNFFIEIDNKKNLVNIYKNGERTLFVCCIDFNKPDDKINCCEKEINDNAIAYVVIKTYQALQKNEFPQYLSYCA